MSMSMGSLRWHFTNKSVTGAPYSIKSYSLSHSWTPWWRVRWLKHAVSSWGRGGTAAMMVQNEQTTEEHSTLEQQSPGRLNHPAWCVVCQHDIAHICCWVPCCGAVDAGRPPLSINISCQHGAQQQTCHMPLLQSNDGTNRWKDTRPFHRPCSAYYVGSDNNPLLHQSVSPFAQNENIKFIRNVLQHATLKNLFTLTELRFYIPLNTN